MSTDTFTLALPTPMAGHAAAERSRGGALARDLRVRRPSGGGTGVRNLYR